MHRPERETQEIWCQAWNNNDAARSLPLLLAKQNTCAAASRAVEECHVMLTLHEQQVQVQELQPPPAHAQLQKPPRLEQHRCY